MGDSRTGVLTLKREYPDPRTLPAQPSWQQPRPQLTLSELTPGQYISTTAKIAYVKTSERTDDPRGQSGFKKLLLGSVASGVVTYAHCPVIVVK